MKTLITISLFVSVFWIGCVAPDEARRVLEQQGYTEIQTGGYAFWACSEDDRIRTKFTATSPSGHRVSGAVCSGLLLKNSTIRFR